MTFILLGSLFFTFSYTQNTVSFEDIKLTQSSVSNTRKDSTFINYLVVEKGDTLFFNSFDAVLQCNYLQKLDRQHNKCRLNINGEYFSGEVILELVGSNEISEYRGSIIDGFYDKGTIKKYNLEKTLILKGRYRNNWKVGVWKLYEANGKKEEKLVYRKHLDEPIKEIDWKN